MKSLFSYRIKPLALTAFAASMLCAYSYSFAAAAVQPISGGIKLQQYKMEWCSPHNVLAATTCNIGYLTNIGGVATLSYNGQYFIAGDAGNLLSDTVGSNLAKSSGSGTLATLTTANGLINLFANSIPNFALQGE